MRPVNYAGKLKAAQHEDVNSSKSDPAGSSKLGGVSVDVNGVGVVSKATSNISQGQSNPSYRLMVTDTHHSDARASSIVDDSSSSAPSSSPSLSRSSSFSSTSSSDSVYYDALSSVPSSPDDNPNVSSSHRTGVNTGVFVKGHRRAVGITSNNDSSSIVQNSSSTASANPNEQQSANVGTSAFNRFDVYRKGRRKFVSSKYSASADVKHKNEIDSGSSSEDSSVNVLTSKIRVFRKKTKVKLPAASEVFSRNVDGNSSSSGSPKGASAVAISKSEGHAARKNKKVTFASNVQVFDVSSDNSMTRDEMYERSRRSGIRGFFDRITEMRDDYSYDADSDDGFSSIEDEVKRNFERFPAKGYHSEEVNFDVTEGREAESEEGKGL